MELSLEAWHEVLVNWSSLGDDRVVPFLTSDDDHCVGLMAGVLSPGG